MFKWNSPRGINVQSSVDFALIRWRDKWLFKILTKTKSELVSHAIEMSTLKTGQLSCLLYMEFSRAVTGAFCSRDDQ